MNKQELLKTLEEWKKYRNSQNHELQYYQLAEVINLVEQLNVEKNLELNPNQQIVLEWLKEQVSVGNDLQYVLWEFTDNVNEEPATYSVSEQTKAWLELPEQEQFQVLSAFADWGMKEVAK